MHVVERLFLVSQNPVNKFIKCSIAYVLLHLQVFLGGIFVVVSEWK